MEQSVIVFQKHGNGPRTKSPSFTHPGVPDNGRLHCESALPLSGVGGLVVIRFHLGLTTVNSLLVPVCFPPLRSVNRP